MLEKDRASLTRLETLAAQAKELTPALKLAEQLQLNPDFARLTQEMARHQESLRRMMGPMEDLKRLSQSGVWTGLESVRAASAVLQKQFRFPKIDELSRSLDFYRASPIAKIIAEHAESARGFSKAMESMHTPWIDALDPMRSLGGFSELQAIGQALRSLPAFEGGLAALLRDQFGDWRDQISWPEAIEDIVERSAFYKERGFNFNLTEFPSPAFEQGVEIAGLRRAPALVELYGPPVSPSENADQEEGLLRTNQAHNWLLRLETQIRECIDKLMVAACGPSWPKHRMPNGIYEQWLDKKNKAEAAGAPNLPLIAYADFTDYALIILRSDNWREAFAPVFRREANIRESLQRLYPIRLCTMHARLITQEDEMLLYVETARIIKAIKRTS